jgi:hypothetical protein
MPNHNVTLTSEYQFKIQIANYKVYLLLENTSSIEPNIVFLSMKTRKVS